MSKAQGEDRKAVPLPAFLDRNRILNVAQMAEGLGYSIPHIRPMYRSGQIPKPLCLGGRKLGWPAGVLIDLTSGAAAPQLDFGRSGGVAEGVSPGVRHPEREFPAVDLPW